ncbi:Sec-independent protein translocase protein TatB [Castellaniella sp.]|uniref:Sec-independent protein translocase protein TatB n=1 Tax=Castellaniella sp. TaxID=1955812 RepID=UPI00355F58EC
MFDISFSELMLIGVIALIVIGPERLPKVARTVGHLLGRAQRYVNEVKSDIQKEVDLKEISDIKNQMQDAAQSVKSSMTSSVEELKASVTQPTQALKDSLEQARKALDVKSALNTPPDEAATAVAGEVAGESTTLAGDAAALAPAPAPTGAAEESATPAPSPGVPADETAVSAMTPTAAGAESGADVAEPARSNLESAGPITLPPGPAPTETRPSEPVTRSE